jgi:diguanylate cyclase (GGDEF)-like protein
LLTIAERMRTALRSQDVVARLGGDEFALVVESLNRDALSQFENELRVAVAAVTVIGDNAIHPQMSIGWALFPEDGRSAGELLQHADSVMYAQKAKRKGQVSEREKERFTSRAPAADPLGAD